MVLVVIVLPIPPVGARGADAETPTTAMRGDIATSHPSAWGGGGGGGGGGDDSPPPQKEGEE